MKLGLDNKTALVVAAGSGLGQAIALSLANEGAKVAVVGRTLHKLEETCEKIHANGGKALAVEWDISDLTRLEDVISHIEQSLGAIDILVNNTGGPPPSTAMGQTPETWQKFFNSMVLPVFAITDRVLPHMRAQKWGRILTSTSSAIITPVPNLAISNSLRSALVGWSKTLAKEVGADGITTNIIVPGRIATERVHTLDKAKAERENRTVEEIATESTKSIPVGRYGHPEEYADAVTFLASQQASYITGTIIRIDGGLIPSI